MHTPRPDPKVSLIVPFYNDQDRLIARLGVAVEFFKRQSYAFELILVDDGSTQDRSLELRQIFPEAQLIRYSANQGKGHAVRTGMLAARGTYRFFTDADIPFGLKPVEAGLVALEKQGFDLVIGDRQASGSVYHIRQSRLRCVASRAFTVFISWVVVTGVKDTQCGFKGFTAAAAEQIFRRARLNRFAFDVELVYIAFKLKLKLKRISVVLEHITGSTLRLSVDAWRTLGEIFQMKWNHLRGRYD